MASTDATPSPVKAQALRVQFPIYLNTGKKLSAAAGVVAKVTKDQGTPATATNTVTEVSTSGMYYLDLTSTEMNADTVTLSVSSTTTNAMDSDLVIPTQSAGKIKVDLQTWLAGTPNALSSGRVDASVGAYPGNTAQTGDSYARIGATGSSLTSLAPSATALSTAVWTAPPTGFLMATFPSSVGTSTLTQAQVTGGSYALNSASFAFNAALPFTTAQLAATLNANLVQWLGGTPSTLNAGLVQSDVELVAGSDVAGALRDLSYDYSTGTLPISIGNDIQGKVLGGGVSAFTGPGANANIISIIGDTEGATGLYSLSVDYRAGTLNCGLGGDVTGDIGGKVLGGGVSTITGIGAQVSGGGSGSGPTLSEIVDGVWTAPIANYLEPGQTGAALKLASQMDVFVWDTPLTSHLYPGSTGLALSSAGSAGDPWNTYVPAAYPEGTAGYLFGRLTAPAGNGPLVPVPDATEPDQTNAYLPTYNGQGGLQGRVSIEFIMLEVPSSGSYTQVPFLRYSNSSGQLVTPLRKSTQYKAKRENGDYVTFTTGSGSTYALPAILGL